MTSSKMRTTSFSPVILRTSSRYPFSGGTTPTFPRTGSMMTHPMLLSFSRRSDMACASLYSTVRVYLAAPSGTPLEEGMPSADPEPAFTSTASWAPWKPPFIFTMPSLPENPLAVRIACIVASVPEQASLTISAEGIESWILLRSDSSGPDGAP